MRMFLLECRVNEKVLDSLLRDKLVPYSQEPKNQAIEESIDEDTSTSEQKFVDIVNRDRPYLLIPTSDSYIVVKTVKYVFHPQRHLYFQHFISIENDIFKIKREVLHDDINEVIEDLVSTEEVSEDISERIMRVVT